MGKLPLNDFLIETVRILLLFSYFILWAIQVLFFKFIISGILSDFLQKIAHNQRFCELKYFRVPNEHTSRLLILETFSLTTSLLGSAETINKNVCW